MTRAGIAAVAACMMLAALAAGIGAATGTEQNAAASATEVPKFQEIPWPFLMDQWGKGKAFQCAPADCGVEVNLFVRPKIGFCNCLTGVSDDQELDRVGDIALLSEAFVPLGDGEPVAVGWMMGRMRLYDAAPRYATKQNALAVAFNDQCDVIVATVTSKRQLSVAAERAALLFLNSDTVLQWARKELGL
jgi:hypothetical protein